MASASPTGGRAASACVAGDGTGARALAASSGRAAPAWRPGSPHTLTWIDAAGRIVMRDVDSGRAVWRSPGAVGAARELLWSADGGQLLVRGDGWLRRADLATGRVRRVRLPGGQRAVAAAWSPRGRRVAVVVRRGTVSRLLVAGASSRILDRPVFATTGRLAGPAWSPDGRRVLVRWAEADEWLLIPVRGAGRGRITAIAPVARRFGGTPTVRGWCCAPR